MPAPTSPPFYVLLSRTFLEEAAPAFDDARGAAVATPDDDHMVRLERAVKLHRRHALWRRRRRARADRGSGDR